MTKGSERLRGGDPSIMSAKASVECGGGLLNRDKGGCGVPRVQELPGHKDARTPMTHTHALSRGGRGVKSPVDAL